MLQYQSTRGRRQPAFLYSSKDQDSANFAHCDIGLTFDGTQKVAHVLGVGIGVSVASGVGCYSENGRDSNPLPSPNRMETERQTAPNWGTSSGVG